MNLTMIFGMHLNENNIYLIIAIATVSTLAATFDLHLKNISHKHCKVRGRALIFGMCVSCDKALSLLLEFSTLSTPDLDC